MGNSRHEMPQLRDVTFPFVGGYTQSTRRIRALLCAWRGRDADVVLAQLDPNCYCETSCQRSGDQQWRYL